MFIVSSRLYYYNLIQLPETPDSPYLFTANQINYDGNLALNWTMAARAENYSLYMNTTPFSDISDATLLLTGITDLNYTDIESTPGTYYYRVLACGNFGNSSPSNLLEIIYGNISPPAAPALSIYSNSPCIANITLNWTTVNGADHYDIYRAFHLIPNIQYFSPIVITNSSVLNFTDQPDSGFTYYWAVVAVNASAIFDTFKSNLRLYFFTDLPTSSQYSFANVSDPSHNIVISWTPSTNAQNYSLFKLMSYITNVSSISVYQTFTNSQLTFTDTNQTVGNYFLCRLSLMNPG